MRSKGIEPLPQVSDEASKKIEALIAKRGVSILGARQLSDEGKVNG